MKIALLADLHLGFGYRRHSKDPRREDSFRNAAEAIRIASERADAILIAGDIFDRPDVSTDIFLRALEIFDLARKRNSGVLVDGEHWNGVPIIAIRGNHDVRSDLHRHPVLLLDRAHRLKYINAETVTLEKDGERVAVTGAGWVPDKNPELVRRYFSERIPRPVPGAYNILMLHQPLEGIGRYPGETPLPVSLLPPGFDLYNSGHLHWHVRKRVSDRWIVIPGSTVRTQLSDREVEDDRAFWIIDTATGDLEEVSLPSARRGFLRTIKVDGLGRDKVSSNVISAIEDALSKNDRPVPPIIKIVLEGSTYDVFDLSPIVSRYEDRAIVKIFDRTTSAVAERLAEVASSSVKDDEVFSSHFARTVLEEALSAAGLSVGSEFDRFYAVLTSAGRLSRPEDRDVLLENVESILFSAVDVASPNADSRELPSAPERQASKRAAGTILDWAEN